jgi:PKHD-type hydroxylase
MTVYALPRFRGRHYRTFAALGLRAADRAGWEDVLGALPLSEATIARPDGNQVVDAVFRGARVGWLHPGPGTACIFDRLAEAAERLNAEAYGFDLLGFSEPVQYTVYESPSVGYDWHLDMIESPSSLQRKLSLTVQLSDGSEYEGGDLELRDGAHVVVAPRGEGTVVAFPGWALHRVTPVTRGVRRSLVAWVSGPEFR